jgi:transposase
LRAAILLCSLAGQSDEAIAERHHVSRGTVVLCIRKCLEFGLDAALGELPRPGRPRQLTDDAVVWVQHCACQKPKELGYSYELWTYKLLTAHVRQHCVAAGHPGLQTLSRSKLHKILRQAELRPHKIRYYVECRDLNFEAKMAIVLHIYKEVEIVNEYRQGEAGRQLEVVTISYDEKPGIQALGVTTLDRPPVVGTHASHLRDYEYKRLGTVSLLAGLDLHSGKVIETVSDTHKSADFIAFLKKLEAAYPTPQKIRLVLDNHSAHISKETRNYLDTVPGRFLFVFTPTHGSWLNLIENQFSKMTRTMLRGIRVASKQELIDRIHQYFAEINAAPVVFR